MSGARLLVLGSGFGALTAARELRRRAPGASITLVSPRPEFVYLPSLIWVPAGLRRGQDLTLPLQGFLARHRLEHMPASVTGLAEGGRTVLTDQGALPNDGLIIATGGRFLKKMPGIEPCCVSRGVEIASSCAFSTPRPNPARVDLHC